MNNDTIIEKVEEAIAELYNEYQNEPSLFYNEHDLMHRLGTLLDGRLEEKYLDKENQPHRLMHYEFATLEKCFMKDGGYTSIPDDVKRFKEKKVGRGHFDLVVLNPEAIQSNTTINLSNPYFKYCRFGIRHWSEENGKPIFLYALEMMDLERISQGNKEKIWQDLKKLIALRDKGYVRKIKFLVFLWNNPKEDRIRQLREEFRDYPEVIIPNPNKKE